MADAKLFQFGEQFICAIPIQMFDATAAVAGDDPQLANVRMQQSWNKTASAPFEVSQQQHFITEARQRIRAVIGLEHPAIKAEVHSRTECVFDVQHPIVIQRVPKFRRIYLRIMLNFSQQIQL